MQKAEKQNKPKQAILKAVLIFLCSYLIFLVLWIQVKDSYSKGIIYGASHLVTLVKDAEFGGIKQVKDIMKATFKPSKHKAGVHINIPVKTSAYTFNAPLTFAIMASLYLFIGRRKRAYAEALLLLLFIHLLYVFSLEMKELTQVFIDMGLEKVNKTRIFAYQFLWTFTDNMVIRFEPFLIGVYMFIRFKAGRKT
jgi:hypothetical protein